MWRVWLSMIAATCWAAPAAAQESQPRLVLHPLGVVTGFSGHDDVAAVLALEAARQPVDLVGSAEAAESLGNKQCLATDDACLAALARATQARFALKVELLSAREVWEFRAAVVRDDGALVRWLDSVREPLAEGKPLRGARQAVRKLLEALSLGSIARAAPLPKSARADRAAAERAAAERAAAERAAAERAAAERAAAERAAIERAAEGDFAEGEAPRGGGVRYGGIAVGVLGLAAVATGGALGLVAADEARGITPTDGAIPAEQLEARKASDAKATAAAALAVGGGVAAAAGLLMILLGGPSEHAEVSLSAGPGGAMVGVTVAIP